MATGRFFKNLYKRTVQIEMVVLTGLLLLGGGIWGFLEIADEVMEGDTHAIDTKLILAMRAPDDVSDPVGPKWMEEMARDTTALGGMGFLGFVTISVCGLFLLERKPRYALFVLVAVCGGLLLSQGFKAGFDRPRPDLVPHNSHVQTASFPSGHSTLSAVTYLTLGAMLAAVNTKRRIRLYYLFLACFITVMVGCSRVYLGVHWPSDVVAGWSLGLSWSILCLLALRIVSMRKKTTSASGFEREGLEKNSSETY